MFELLCYQIGEAVEDLSIISDILRDECNSKSNNLCQDCHQLLLIRVCSTCNNIFHSKQEMLDLSIEHILSVKTLNGMDYIFMLNVVKYFQHSVGIFVEELMDGMDVNGSGLMNHYCNSICQITVIDLPECVPWGLLSQDGTAIFSRFKGIHKGKSSDFTM